MPDERVGERMVNRKKKREDLWVLFQGPRQPYIDYSNDPDHNEWILN